MKSKQRKKLPIVIVKTDHWAVVGGITYVTRDKKKCSGCKKRTVRGNHLDFSTWMCTRCLKLRAKNINQDLLKLPSFLEELPKLGSK